MAQDPNATCADNDGPHHTPDGNRPAGIAARNRRSLILTTVAVASVAAAGVAWLGVRLDTQWLALTGIGIFLAMATLWSALALATAFKLLKTVRWRRRAPAGSATSEGEQGADHESHSR